MSLADATKALEVVDARLVAISRELTEFAGWDGDPESGRVIINEIVDRLDLVLDDVRGAAADIVKHDCLLRTLYGTGGT